MPRRSILHVDMDAFYASVEQRDKPELRGRPLVVGGGRNRGVVAAASYEAREYGIRSAMPMAEALRRCPELLCVRPRMAYYRGVSRQVFAVFREFTPAVEGLSLDEAFLDVTASRRLFGNAREIATRVKQRIYECTGLRASVGVAWNKLLAKIASDLEKPDGLVEITPDNCRRLLDPLPVAVIPGIGRETVARLRPIGISTVGDLRRADIGIIEPVFGRFSIKTRDRAAGIDDRPVVPSRDEKSISAEETYDQDLVGLRSLERELLRLAERTCRRLRKSRLQAGSVQIKIRQSDFSTFTRQSRLQPPANGTDRIYAAARRLLATWVEQNPAARIRLLGVGVSRLARFEQADLFAEAADGTADPLDRTVDEIRERFGEGSVGRASTLDTHGR